MRVIGFAGWSGSGKTTLLEQLIGLLVARGLTVSLIKHTHHDLAAETPGKDTWRHRQAGCREVILCSATAWQLGETVHHEPAPTIERLLAQLAPCDVVLIEGYKRAPLPKIEVFRPALGKPPLYPHDPHVIAVASDAPVDTALPRLDLNDPQGVAGFLITYLRLAPSAGGSG